MRNLILSMGSSGSLCMLLLCLSWNGAKSEMLPSKPSPNVTNKEPLQDHPEASPSEEKLNLPMFTMDYPRIQMPFELTLWVLLACFAKISLHVYPKITIWIPECCLLIVIGFIGGAVMHYVREEPLPILDSNVFFLYMLPPIVLGSGYFMPTRPFFENVGTVLWYAVVGSLWNSAAIGLSLYGICHIELFGVQDINLQENLLFGCIVSTLDPVAVLSVFEDIGVNEQLHIVVFGEGIFNDAIVVVLYNMLTFVAEMPAVHVTDLYLGVARFFLVGLGAVLLGFLFSIVAAFTTRFTANTRSIEPLFILLYSYLAYLVAELFAISSLLTIVTCGITMKYYVEQNISAQSCTTIRQVLTMLATISETLIFFSLGVAIITMDHEWNLAYILFTLLFALLWRVLGVLVLSQIAKPFRTFQFDFKEQLGLACSGLRGSLCFALAFTLPDSIQRRKLFITASICIIIISIFTQGLSMRPIVECMNFRRTNKELKTINVENHKRLMEHVVVGIEDLCGQWSHHYWKDKFKKFNNRVLGRILVPDSQPESSIVALYKKLQLEKAMELLETPVGDLSTVPPGVSLPLKLLCRGQCCASISTRQDTTEVVDSLSTVVDSLSGTVPVSGGPSSGGRKDWPDPPLTRHLSQVSPGEGHPVDLQGDGEKVECSSPSPHPPPSPPEDQKREEDRTAMWIQTLI